MLISGGGSALLPAPAAGLTLADKQAVTRFLMHSGATIGELNTVRKHLSRIKGGNLARACRAGQTLSLIISDVVGDPLDVIASGPTVADSSTAAEALAVLQKFSACPPVVPQAVFDVLELATRDSNGPRDLPASVENHVIGNNAVALAAAARRATELGYTVQSLGSSNQGEASAVGRDLAERCLQLRAGAPNEASRLCLLSGGEPVVHLAQTNRPAQGRTQSTTRAGRPHKAVGRRHFGNHRALGWHRRRRRSDRRRGRVCRYQCDCPGAGTKHLDPHKFLAINDAYHFFEQAGGLIKTGPTHTNVMDLRVALVDSPARNSLV